MAPGCVHRQADGKCFRPGTLGPFRPSGKVFLLGSLWSGLPLLVEAYIPPQIFYNGKVDYFDLQRLGGLLSHLRKTLKGENTLVCSCRVPTRGRQSPGPACSASTWSTPFPDGGMEGAARFQWGQRTQGHCAYLLSG